MSDLRSSSTHPGLERFEPGSHAGPSRLRDLLRAVVAVGSDLDLEATLRRIVESAVSLVGARYGALGVIDESGTRLAQFITVGVDDATHRAIGALPKGLGLLGELINDARPLRLADLSDHPSSGGFPVNHPPMRSFLGVPIRVRAEVFGSLYLTNKVTDETFTDVDEELAVALAAAAGVAIDHARLFERERRQRDVLAAMQELATAFVAGTDSRQNLQLVARHARLLVGADVATVALPDPSDDTMVIEVADGQAAATMLGERFPIAGSVSGEVLRTGRTAVIEDAAYDHRVTQPQVRMGAIGPSVCVALQVDGGPFGTLAIGRSRGASPFTPEELELVAIFAAHASVVVGHEQARQQRIRLTSLEGQERIARNLHDTVIQRLFATGLLLQRATGLLVDHAARGRVEDAVEELDQVIRTIRTVIFDVQRPIVAHEAGLRRRVLDLTHDLADVLGAEPGVIFTGAVDSSVSARVGDELLATLREALSNVARHAHANRIDVELSLDGDALILRVRDDGIGVEAGAPDLESSLGISNMRARAELLGGGLTLAPGAAGGTLLTWQVHLAADES
jgi:signal transduction histidine kinase